MQKRRVDLSYSCSVSKALGLECRALGVWKVVPTLLQQAEFTGLRRERPYPHAVSLC